MEYKTKKNYLQTLKENFGSEGSQFASGSNNNPLHGTIASATIVIFLIKFMQCCLRKNL